MFDIIAFITQLIPQLIENVTSSDVALGMASAAVIGSLVFLLREIPNKIWQSVKYHFVLTMTIYHDDAFYRYASMWLSQHMDPRRSRNVSVGSTWDEDSEREVHALIPGPGLHLIRYNKRFWLVNREVEKPGDKDNSWLMKRNETLTIQTFGRDQAILKELMDKALSSFEDRSTIPVFFWNSGRFEMAGRRAKRPLDTIYMDEAQKKRIIADIMNFLNKRSWYAARGIPWRRGYSFEGPPGTGKTSLIFAIASLLGKPIYIINPATMSSDNALQEAINAAGNGIVVIEDIDSITILEERKEKASPGGRSKKKDDKDEGLTLSGFLNAIDGIASQEGRLLFITSNHAGKLDEALMRPGRIDRREVLGLADEKVARQMFSKFCPDQDPADFIREIKPQLPMSTAAIQNALIKREAPELLEYELEKAA